MRIAYSEMRICLFVMRDYIAFNNNNKNNIGEIGPTMASRIAIEEKEIEMPCIQVFLCRAHPTDMSLIRLKM